ncbi:MAG: hypothetical protein Q9218_002205 [Villophora microphyllina]
MAADRSSQTLARLFEQLPEALRTGRLKSVSAPAKKRPAPSKTPGPHELPPVPSMGTKKSHVQSPTDGSSASSNVANPDWRRASQPYNSPRPPRQSMTNADLTLRHSPQQGFTPTDPSSMGYQQHNSPPGSVPPSGTQASFPNPHSTENPGFPDLSSMMFPSDDPFAYPNQPMMTLENYQSGTQAQAFNTPAFPVRTNGDSYDNFNAPYFGPMPSYSTSSIRQDPNITDGQGDSGSMNINSDHRRIQDSQQGRFGGQAPGSTWGAMFGEDWSGGWAEQGYGQ